MSAVHVVTRALVIIGGLNWGLVALAEFDLVAWIVGLNFGQTNVAARIVYGVVGLAALYPLAELTALRRDRALRRQSIHA
jgi:uncharacterized protein